MPVSGQGTGLLAAYTVLLSYPKIARDLRIVRERLEGVNSSVRATPVRRWTWSRFMICNAEMF